MDSSTMRLDGKRVAILAADGFEYVELSIPAGALRLAGAAVEVISLHRGKIRGMNLTEPTKTVAVDRTLEEADPAQYDALLIPGGFIGPDFLRQSQLAREFVESFDALRKPIATLCHGPWLLVSAGLVRGRHLSAWPGIRDDIVHAGGLWHDEALVSDRNWVSSRGPQDLPQFIPAMLELFANGEVGAELGAGDGDGDRVTPDVTRSSPKREQPPGLAVRASRLLPGPTLRTVGVAAIGTAAGVMIARRLG
jgi:protease I